VKVNLLKLLSEMKVTEDTGAGAVAGFSAPMGDKNSIVKKKNIDEDDKSSLDKQDTESFDGKNFEITKSYRGPNKGYTLMIRQKEDNGTIFASNEKVQQILNYIESNF